MSNLIAIYYLMENKLLKDYDRWWSVKEISKEINLSIDRTRKHLSLLTLSGDIETKVEGWKNVYRFRR
jgi:hypothetical protein